MRTGLGKAEERQSCATNRIKSCRPDQALSFCICHHLCRQGVALAGTRQLCLPGPVSVHARRTGGVTDSERQEGTNWVGGEIRNGSGFGDWNGVGVGNGDVKVDEDGGGAETRTEVGANEGTQEDWNGDGSGDGSGAGTGMGVETRGRTQEGNGEGSGDGNESGSGNGNGTGTWTETGRVEEGRGAQKHA